MLFVCIVRVRRKICITIQDLICPPSNLISLNVEWAAKGESYKYPSAWSLKICTNPWQQVTPSFVERTFLPSSECFAFQIFTKPVISLLCGVNNDVWFVSFYLSFKCIVPFLGGFFTQSFLQTCIYSFICLWNHGKSEILFLKWARRTNTLSTGYRWSLYFLMYFEFLACFFLENTEFMSVLVFVQENCG